MSKLNELRAKYGFAGGKYEPKEDCAFCGGTGERDLKHRDGKTFCICLFVEHELSEFAGKSLAETARKLREELEHSQPKGNP